VVSILRCLWPAIFLACGPIDAAEVQVAVAANFATAMKGIARRFEEATGHTLKLTFGSSGKFFAQIMNGAPFEVFLSADVEKPMRLEEQAMAVEGSRFTYAVGSLVLWSRDPKLIEDDGSALYEGKFNHLAVANPRLAPYGAAAADTLMALGLWDELQSRIVRGENVSQTYQFVATGNAELGFVALSQITQDGKIAYGSAWIVPAVMYSPIRQEAVLLNKGRHNKVASALLQYLRGSDAKAIIKAHGYRLD
jgi:molybdate transport system substrate-binding protein